MRCYLLKTQKERRKDGCCCGCCSRCCTLDIQFSSATRWADWCLVFALTDPVVIERTTPIRRRRATTSRRPCDGAEIASCEQGFRFTPPSGLRPCSDAIINTSPWHLMQNTRREIPSNLLPITFPWETKLTFINGDDLITLVLRGEGEGKKAGYVTLTTASDGSGVQWPSHQCRYEELNPAAVAQPR